MNRPGRAVWHLPALLGIISGIGLLAALLFDRWGDGISWIALTVVALLSLWTCVKGLAPARAGVPRPYARAKPSRRKR
jgi:hypothetical protein